MRRLGPRPRVPRHRGTGPWPGVCTLKGRKGALLAASAAPASVSHHREPTAPRRAPQSSEKTKQLGRTEGVR